ncbi:hypothetical protein RZS08_30060, partial [Arthrospira platensis SPKY1]|nr:hypothetical protein [Arthrospira platensis SPKY1]
MPLDAALVTLSPPDEQGYCSLGCSVDVSHAAVESARMVIAQINPNMPYVHGDGQVHVSRIHAACWVDEPLFELKADEPSAIEAAIGQHVASLVEDGATLQMGIGGIPNAVLRYLESHRHL